MVTHFYRDSSGGGGLAQSLRIQAHGPDGTCADVTGEIPVGTDGAPAVDVLTPRPGGYLTLGETLGEIEMYVKVPS